MAASTVTTPSNSLEAHLTVITIVNMIVIIIVIIIFLIIVMMIAIPTCRSG